jgi:plasmid stabilization system protein ParE
MKQYAVIFTPRAEGQLAHLYGYIADESYYASVVFRRPSPADRRIATTGLKRPIGETT